MTVIHPSAVVDSAASIGDGGTVIVSGSTVASAVEVAPPEPPQAADIRATANTPIRTGQRTSRILIPTCAS